MSHVNDLVTSWSHLEGQVQTLGNFVSSPEQQLDIPIEQLEEQLNILKGSFKEKQQMVKNMEDKCKKAEAVKTPGGLNINLRRMTIAPAGMMARKISVMPDKAPQIGL